MQFFCFLQIMVLDVGIFSILWNAVVICYVVDAGGLPM